MTDKPNRVVIMNKARGVRYEQKFFQEIQEAILNGYRLPAKPDRTNVSMRNFKGGGRCVLFLEGCDPTAEVKVKEAPIVLSAPVVEPTVETESDPLLGMTKKVELLAFAKENNIEVDKEITQPVKIKKIIKEALQKQ